MARGRARLWCLLLAWAALAVVSLLVGTTGVGLADYWRQSAATEHRWTEFVRSLADLPLPRLLLGTLAGAALSVAGAMFQALFRNPLASPYTLGVSSSASLGAAVAIAVFGTGVWHGFSVVSAAAFAGAIVCVSIVYVISGVVRHHGAAALLLAGLTLGFLTSALVVLIMYLAEIRDADRILRWMMGSLEIVGLAPIYEVLALTAVAGGVAAWLHRDLDLFMMGEQLAASRGVSLRWSRRLIYFSASLLTAGVVAHCGPIGFVGLLVPHICRALVGPTHHRLLPACAFVGAIFLPFCD
ncbi:MAG TPA: iron ABC transporter permease, partial [Phycisphaerae bacterium]|nr:iron ABC transporter permease [Phycisphaerae bacterium]